MCLYIYITAKAAAVAADAADVVGGDFAMYVTFNVVNL